MEPKGFVVEQQEIPTYPGKTETRFFVDIVFDCDDHETTQNIFSTTDRNKAIDHGRATGLKML